MLKDYFSVAITRKLITSDSVVNYPPQPHTQYGYSYGPVKNPNPDWKPSSIMKLPEGKRAAAKVSVKSVQDDIEAGSYPPKPFLKLNRVNSMVCPVIVAGDDPLTQCGTCYTTQASFREHLRQKHTGCCKSLYFFLALLADIF